ncbi:hypothetical protein B9Z55_008028 [Caenorhabditis nigoni]|uniref:Uncharacterized protein n=1 Tax=Caenorhabditis nigoni TaxID=1611254 RepID=A0A2G5VCD9_9PELO|nr:hypothetical protein B9Z55_008028 [Caenorhabditis nigoni]
MVFEWVSTFKNFSDLEEGSENAIEFLVYSLQYGMPPIKIERIMPIINNCTTPKQKEVFEEACDQYYAESKKSKDELIESGVYEFCCNIIGTCFPFYTETWFYIVCGGVGLLVLMTIAFVVYSYSFRKKKLFEGGAKSRGGTKSSESTSKKSRK